MPKGSYKEFPMVVEQQVLGLISTTADIIERFNIPDAVVNLQVPGINRTRKAHERKVYNNANGTASTTTTNVEQVIKVYTPQKRRTNAGKKIKLDTGLRSVPTSLTGDAATAPNAGSVRYATVNFPSGVSNYQIARWITVNIPEARRPSYFVTPSGVRQRTNVAAVIGQTAGENTPTT